MGKLPAEYINLEGPMELASLKKDMPFSAKVRLNVILL
jgi:hypothetical protein